VLARFIYSNGLNVEYITIVFECQIVDGKLNPDNDEIKDLKYLKETEIPPIANPYPKEIFSSEHTDRAIFE
jgi:hypothetical protein